MGYTYINYQICVWIKTLKTKLNLTIDKELVPKSKEYAIKKGKSVSKIVEELLWAVTKEASGSFSKKWKGKLKLTAKNSTRYNKLKKRYKL